jgi:hypothetical protein
VEETGLILERHYCVRIEADGDRAPRGDGNVPRGCSHEPLPISEFDDVFEDCAPIDALDKNAGQPKRSLLGIWSDVNVF